LDTVDRGSWNYMPVCQSILSGLPGLCRNIKYEPHHSESNRWEWEHAVDTSNQSSDTIATGVIV